MGEHQRNLNVTVLYKIKIAGQSVRAGALKAVAHIFRHFLGAYCSHLSIACFLFVKVPALL